LQLDRFIRQLGHLADLPQLAGANAPRFCPFHYPEGGSQNPFKAKKFRVYSSDSLVALRLLA